MVESRPMSRETPTLNQRPGTTVARHLKTGVLCFLLVVCVCKAVLHFGKPSYADAHVYETAAYLVRVHQSGSMYNGADTGRDPQLVFAKPDSAFARAARARGIDSVRLYVYPPTLADILSPITYFSTHTDDLMWSAASVGMLLIVAWMTAEMSGIAWRSLAFVPILLLLLTTYPVWLSLFAGQISIGLLFLWAAGVYCYWRRWIPASAALFALAASIKVYPGVVLLAFLLWKEWRWVRWFAISLLGIWGLCALLNGTSTLLDFFQHVAPAMSNGVLNGANRSLQGATELMGLAARGHSIETGSYVPRSLLLAGKLLSVLVACAFAAGLAWRRRSSHAFRIVVLALMALLASVLSPVAWIHTYSLTAFPLILLWIEAMQAEITWPYFTVLSISTLELTWLMVSYLFLNHAPGRLAAIGYAMTPLSAVGVMFWRLLLADRISADWLAGPANADEARTKSSQNGSETLVTCAAAEPAS